MSRKQIALLRGINVGRAKRVAMADLRKLMLDLGYQDVKTLLNSGNIVYSARTSPAQSARRIEDAIFDRLGVRSRVTVLTAAELADVVAGNSIIALSDNPSRMFVSFLTQPSDLPQLAPLVAKDWGREVLALGTRVAYIWCPDGIAESMLAEAVGRALGDAVTTRNWSTVTKLDGVARQAP